MRLGNYKLNDGYEFKVHAPNANSVELFIKKEKFNMTNVDGVWGVSIPGISENEPYSYLIDGVEKIDLFANKIVEHKRGKPKSVTYNSDYFFKHPKVSAPVSKIKEVYLKKIPGSNLKEKTNYIIGSSHGYSHIQIMPFHYTPNEKTLGYKTSTYFAPDPTLGDLDDIKKMIDDLHSANLGVILDFCIFEFEEFSSNGLFNYDGTPLYEYDDRRQHPYFTGYLFDLSKSSTQSLIRSVIEFYVGILNIDGIRFDGVNEILFMNQDDHSKINQVNLNFFRDLINSLDKEILVICDLITHKSLSYLGLERINHVEGSLLQFQLHKIFSMGQTWFLKNRVFESKFLRNTFEMIKKHNVLATINHDVFLNGLKGDFRNNDLNNEDEAQMFKYILYAVPKPKLLWFDVDLEDEFTKKLDSLSNMDFNAEVIDSGILNFKYTDKSKTTIITFKLFQNKIEIMEV